MTTTVSNDLAAVARRFYLAFDSGTPARMDELIAADAVDHDGATGDEPARTTMRGLVAMLGAGFSDYRHDLELVLPAGPDLVFVRWRMEGTHSGDVYGMKATGRRVTLRGHDVIRVQGGLIVEVWHIEQLLQLVQQLQAAA
jgi:predicted ester cyclase